MDAPPVQYVKTSDGYDIAYCVAGEGQSQSLILLPLAFSSVQTVWRHFPAWMQALAKRFRVIVFDARGQGLSTRGLPKETSASDFVLDIQAVTERFEGERFVFFAQGGSGHDAVRYADQNPGKVDGVIWLAAAVKNSAWGSALWQTYSNENWPAFLLAMVPPGLNANERQRRIREYGDAVRLEDRNIFMRTHFPSDVEDELQRLKAPMLVIHPKDFPWLPVEESRKVAARVTNAQFVSVDGERALTSDVAQSLAAIDAFMANLPPRASLAPPDPLPNHLSAREIEVLRLVEAGRSNQQIANELVISLNTVRRHVSNVFDKTGVANRTEAASYARDHGLA